MTEQNPEPPTPAEQATCSEPGCVRSAAKRGRCWSHYEQGGCRARDCGEVARRNGLCWGHLKHRQRSKPPDTELTEPRGAARDRRGIPRRTLLQQLLDAAIDLADANAEGSREAYERAVARLRVASLRHGRASPEQRPHLG